MPISNIFNCSIQTGIFPDEWKSARVTPVFKNGSRSDLSNYRPISILPIIAKMFKKIIYMISYTNTFLLIICFQTANQVLEHYVVLLHLLNSTDNWRLNIDKGQINGVVFIDLKKVFDIVDMLF